MSAMIETNPNAFDATVLMPYSLERLVLSAAQEMTERAVTALASHYNFDAAEALALLNLSTAKVVRKAEIRAPKPEKREKAAKIEGEKFICPFPYSGQCDYSLCRGLRQNCEQYTQCKNKPKEGKMYCTMCQTSADANEGVPEYGTIEQRQAVDIFEYVTPKGRKPLPFPKIMRKFNVTKDEVLDAAGKLNINIDERHFEESVVVLVHSFSFQDWLQQHCRVRRVY